MTTGKGTSGAILLMLVLVALTAWIYWPGITGPALLDDRSSVMVIQNLKEQPELAPDYIFGDSSGLLGRSVSMATFVAERVYLDGSVATSKAINILLHLANGGLVIWLLWLLFRHLAVPGYHYLAVALGAIWLLHPLWVSTVLYMVQRMAMLSTFFMLLTLISYIGWRRALGRVEGVAAFWRFLPVPLFLVLGLFAKENAIVVVPTLLLLEVWWFECKDTKGRPIRWLKHTSYGLIVSGAAGLLTFLVLRWGWLADKLHRRPFTLEERLLTESRILWDYVGQWINPQVQRMGIYHDDILLSRSLTEPITTAWSIAAWAALLLTCGVLLRWQAGRWLAFGLAWFLVGHSVESTVLSLELYYEHRNYYPAVGMLIMLGVFYTLLVRRLPEPAAPLLVCLGLCALVLAGQTASQAQIWSQRSLLSVHHLNAHPHSARANIDMAVELAQHGALAAARRYSLAAFEASAGGAGSNERVGDYQVRNLALSCIARQPPTQQQIDKLGVEQAQRPLSSATTLLSLVRLLQDNRCPGFDRIRLADRLAQMHLNAGAKGRASAKIYFDLAVLENALGRYDKALGYTEMFLIQSRWDARGLLMKLHFATLENSSEATAESLEALNTLHSRGLLSRRDQQTMALYLEKTP